MELFTSAKDLKFLDANQIIGEAMKIPAKSPSPLFLITTITLILPLSVIQLLFKISFSYFLLTSYPESIHEFSYNLSLFLMSLLSISVIVFAVGSLYASKSVSFISTLFVIPRIFENLLITFLYALLLKATAYYLIMFTPIYIYDSLNNKQGALWWGALGFLITFAVIYIVVHFYVIALWNLASVISVLEPNVYGLAAMKKSKQLLQGRTKVAMELVNLYFTATWIIGKVFGYVMQSSDHFMFKLILGLTCLFFLVSVNLTALLVQNVFFFACKAHHNQVVDKKVLDDYLCGYDIRDKSEASNAPSSDSVEVQSLVKGHDKVDYQPVALNDTTDV